MIVTTTQPVMYWAHHASPGDIVVYEAAGVFRVYSWDGSEAWDLTGDDVAGFPTPDEAVVCSRDAEHRRVVEGETMTIVYRIVPGINPRDFYAAGYDANKFASEAEAEAAIPGLKALGPEFDIEWIVVQEDLSEG